MISNLCELAGMVAITIGVWLLAGVAAGVIVGGLCALVVGLALDGVPLPSFRRRHGGG